MTQEEIEFRIMRIEQILSCFIEVNDLSKKKSKLLLIALNTDAQADEHHKRI